MKPNQTRYVAALYMRLSKDDDRANESSSIKTQRNMLIAYAKENGFIVYDEYIDDGWSGTNFNRPDFKRMINDIEDKKVNLVITKDLSRLGRDYILSGQYTEIYFPTKGVRYIAINDGYDSESPYTDIAPFKNVINEMYARDTSKKIRSAFVTKMKEGDYIGNFAPYGYEKDPKNKNRLIINKEVSHIVQQIFTMASNGDKPVDIANYLNNQGILTPLMYRCRKYPNVNPEKYNSRELWTSGAINKILKNIVYLGHTAQKKTTRLSFKNHITVQNSKEDWIIVENTHEPIIDKKVFESVQKRSQNRTCEKKGGFVNIFSGIAKCSDCGKNMSTVGTRKKDSPANLACGGYKLRGSSECSNHFIDYNVFYDIVLKSIQNQVKLSDNEQQELLLHLQKELKSNNDTEEINNEIAKLKKRDSELDKIIEKLYEDNFQGLINDDRFKALLQKYENETQGIKEKIKHLNDKLNKNSQEFPPEKAYKEFFSLIKQYSDIKTLSTELLFELIDRIEVGQGQYIKTKDGNMKTQTIKIYYRFIGSPTVEEYAI